MEISTRYSYVPWVEVEPYFKPRMKAVIIEPKPIPKDILISLHNYLRIAVSAHGDVITAKEAKRLFLINPILVHLILLFKRDGTNAEILVEESVMGKNIHTNGQFEFVISRGRKKLYIVEAKKNDLEQGMILSTLFVLLSS